MRDLLSILEAGKPVPGAIVTAPNSGLPPFDVTVPEGEDPEEYARKILETAPLAPVATSRPTPMFTSGRRNLLEALDRPDVKVEYKEEVKPPVTKTPSTYDKIFGTEEYNIFDRSAFKAPVKGEQGIIEDIVELPKSLGEVGLGVGTGVLGWLVGSIRSIAEGTKPDATRESVKAALADSIERMSFEPTTRVAKTVMRPIGKVFEALTDPVGEAAALVGESWQSPLLEAVTKFGGELRIFKAVGKAGKAAFKKTGVVEKLVERKVTPEQIKIYLESNNIHPDIVSEIVGDVQRLGATLSKTERALVESDRAAIAKAKRAVGIEPAERVVAKLESVPGHLKLGPERIAGPVQPTPAPKPPPRPTGVDIGRKELPPGEGFITAKPFEPAPITPVSPFATTGRRTLPPGQGFELVEPPVPVDITPQLNWNKQPFKTEANAEKAALKAGVKAEEFEVVPEGKGFAWKRAEEKAQPVGETSQIDVITEKEEVRKVEAVTPEVVKTLEEKPIPIEKKEETLRLEEYKQDLVKGKILPPEVYTEFPELVVERDKLMTEWKAELSKQPGTPEYIARKKAEVEGRSKADIQEELDDAIVKLKDDKQAFIDAKGDPDSQASIREDIADSKVEIVALKKELWVAKKKVLEAVKEKPIQEGIVTGSGLLLPDGTSQKLPEGHERVKKSKDTLRTSTTAKEIVIDLTLGVDPTPKQLDAIETVIGKKGKETRIGIYKESGKYVHGGVVKSIKEVTRLVNEAKSKTFPTEGSTGTILNSGFDPVAAVNALKATVKDVTSILPYLENLGKYIYEDGKTKYFEWQKEIKSLLGDMWEKFKKYISEVWDRLQKGKIGLLKSQRGAVGLDIGKEPIAKRRVLRMSERTRLNKVADQYKRALEKIDKELADLSGPDGKKIFEELKQKRIDKFFEAIAKLKQDPAAYRKQGYQKAIEMLKKREYTTHVNQLKAAKSRLEKMINRRLEKAVTTRDTTDVMAPTILEKDFKRLKSLPDIRSKPLAGWTQTMIHTWEDWGGMVGPKAATWVKDTFYYPVRTATDKANKHFARVFNKAEAMRSELPKDSGRRIGIYAFTKERGGAEILAEMGITEIPTLTPAEMKVYNWMRGVYDLFYDYVNEGRLAAGKDTFGKVENYFTFARELTEADRLGFGFDDALLVDYIHAKTTTFPYAKHRIGGLKKAQLNAFEVFENYIRAATRHMYLSPEIAKIREYTGQFNYRDSEGKARTWSMKESQPRAYAVVQEYADFVSGQKKVLLPKNVEAVMKMLNKNITYAVLSANVRSTIIQPTALLNTYVEIGPNYTRKGVIGLFTPERFDALKKSQVLFNREFDISVSQTMEGTLGKIGQTRDIVNKSWFGMKALKFLDMETATATWIGAYKKALEVDKLTEERAINYADDTVIRTQASAALHDLSPIQRIILGKLFTTFQTFVINNFNWLVKDVMGIKNPRLSRSSMIHKALRYIIGTTLINFIFEDWLDINSPLASPISAMRREYKRSGSVGHTIFTGGLEMLQLVQGLGGLRYGSSILGAPIEFVGDVGEKLAALGGKGMTYPTRKFSDQILELGGEKGMTTRSSAELLGKALGIPGTSQMVKLTRGLGRGYTVPEAVLGKRYEPKKPSGVNSMRNLLERYRPKLERPLRPY